MAKLHNQNDGSVPVSEMKDGDLAVVTGWPTQAYVGRVVQRYGEYLLTVGAPAGSGWGRYFAGEILTVAAYVRILKAGELIEV